MNRGFRIYDKLEKRMINNPWDKNIFLSGNGNLIDVENYCLYIMNRYVRMDSLGVVAKDKKEVYAGDIIKVAEMHDSNIDYADTLFVVEWVEDYCSYGLTTKPSEKLYRKFNMPLDIKHWKIVGNIYENADLLSDECPKGGKHQWGTDGMHTNMFCKKCFASKPK